MTGPEKIDRGLDPDTYRKAVYRLADGRNFRMSIPAREDDDDLLLMDAIDTLEQLRADKAALIDSRQAAIDERNLARAAVAQLRNHIFGAMQYLHNVNHEGDIWVCPRGICPGVRGVLRMTEGAESGTATQIYVPLRGNEND